MSRRAAHGLLALALVGVLAGCAAPAAEQPAADAPRSTPQAAEETPAGPSREGLIKGMADSWGKMTTTEQAQLCADMELAGHEYMWESLGSPESISEAEVGAIWRDYCAEY